MPSVPSIFADQVRVLLSPKTQTRKKIVNDYFVPSSWNSKWAQLIRRAKIRSRPPYQTRHTYACWNLAAQGNLAFIANQVGAQGLLDAGERLCRWIDSESPQGAGAPMEGHEEHGGKCPKFVPKTRSAATNLLI